MVNNHNILKNSFKGIIFGCAFFMLPFSVAMLYSAEKVSDKFIIDHDKILLEYTTAVTNNDVSKAKAIISKSWQDWATRPYVRTSENSKMMTELYDSFFNVTRDETLKASLLKCLADLGSKKYFDYTCKAFLEKISSDTSSKAYEEILTQFLRNCDSRIAVNHIEDSQKIQDEDIALKYQNKLCAIIIFVGKGKDISSETLIRILDKNISYPTIDNARYISSGLNELARRGHSDVKRYIAICEKSDLIIHGKEGVYYPLRWAASNAKKWVDMYEESEPKKLILEFINKLPEKFSSRDAEADAREKIIFYMQFVKISKMEGILQELKKIAETKKLPQDLILYIKDAVACLEKGGESQNNDELENHSKQETE